MITERARLVSAAYAVADVAMTVAALAAAYGLRSLAGPWVGPLHPFRRYLPLLALILPIWITVFSASGLYGRAAARTLRTELARLVRAVTVAGLLLLFALFALGADEAGRRGFQLDFVSRSVVLLFLLLDGLFVEAGRGLVRAFVLDTSTRRRILIAGAEEPVRHTARIVAAHRDWGLEIAGVVSDGTWDAGPGSPHRPAGVFRDIPELVRRLVVDEVIVAPAPGRLNELPDLESVFLQLEEQGIVMRLVVNFLPRSLAAVSFDSFGGMPLLTFSTGPRNEMLLFVRRLADLVLSSVLLVLLLPVFALVAILIKLTSPGPVLFRQQRCGLNGRPFTFLKFRSMRQDAEALKAALAPFNEMDRPAFKMSRDPRVTPLGRFLRRTSLDELPQLWNIFAGDMSFVGPRPAVLEEVAQYEPWQRRRLSMKPGLTCLWQISGRNDLSFDEWMRLDLEYIDNWSLWLDLKIALLTIPAVLLGRGAR